MSATAPPVTTPATPTPPTRVRLVQSSSELFRRQGYVSTGVKQILAMAGAPFGSLYHHFPGGKSELGAETIRWSGAIYAQLLDEFFKPGTDLVEATELFFAGAAATLVETDYADACPIATVALEVSSVDERMRIACADVFDSWIDTAAARFEESGLQPAVARSAAIELLCALEGAFVLGRALRSTEPLEAAGAAAVTRMAAAVAG